MANYKAPFPQQGSGLVTKCPRCKTGNKVGPRIVTPEMHHDVLAEWCDNEECEYWVERPATPLDYGKVPVDLVIQPDISPVDRAKRLVGEFESIFGKITATERKWLVDHISGQGA